MYRTESEQRSVINLLAVGIVILVLAIIGIVLAFNHQRDEDAAQINNIETTQPADAMNTPAATPTVVPPTPPQIIQVDRPVVEQVPVPVPVASTHTNTV